MTRGRLTCALGVALAGSLLASAAALGQSGGGITVGGDDASTADGRYLMVPFGSRDLRRGNRGDDVKTLNWLLGSNAFGVPFNGDFRSPTDRAVRDFQTATGLNRTGYVHKGTRKALAKRMPVAQATWYGPGLWGNRTACGQRLKKRTVGVAHKRLPCGTRVVFAHRGSWVRAKVIDRGPYAKGLQWDLTRALAKRLGFLQQGAGGVRRAIVRR